MLRTYTAILFAVTALMVSSFATAGYLEHYTEEDGLADNRVSFIRIGESGVKWFATYNSGVCRFDECSWETYPAGRVQDMALDNTGRPWICYMSGICYLDLHAGRFYCLDYPLLSAYSAVTCSPDGALWTGGWVGELEVWRTFNLVQWKCWKGLLPEKFAIDADGRVWFVGAAGPAGAPPNYGVWRISADGESWDRIDDNVRLPSGTRYRSIYASQTGRVWVEAAESPAAKFYSDDYETWVMFDESPFGLSADYYVWIECASEEGIWFRSAHPAYIEGAFYYDYQDWRFVRVACYVGQGLTGMETIRVDNRTGDVWFGTYSNGVYVMRGGPEAWPPVWIELEALVNPCAGAVSVQGSAEFQMDLRLDLYVALELPDKTLLFAPNWSASMAPLVPNLEVPIGLNVNGLPLVTLEVAGIPAGTYRWFAACTHAGSMEFASNIASCEWQFAK
ncbi:MAG TPA: hypothetical protein VM163_01650 [bacterium]|nr:hypothetical protein [bacterium]